MKINRENLEKHLLEYQLSIVGKTLLDTIDDDRWYFNITLTYKQREDFRRYAIKTIKKILKCNTSVAIGVYNNFSENLGLRIKNK